MKKTLITLSLVALSLQATTFEELFAALKSHASSQVDSVRSKLAKVAKEQISSKLYPKVELFAKYEHTNKPSALVPLPPNDMFGLIKNKEAPQPFSEDIFREGARFEMPLYARSIYTLSDMAQKLYQSQEAKRALNLLKNKALIVSADANLLYLQELERSLDTKRRSLLETQKTLRIKVANGRSPQAALYKLDDALNRIAITKNDIALQRQKLLEQIESLTGITLNSPIALPQKEIEIKKQQLASLRPLRLALEAKKLKIAASKQRYYPSVAAYGSYILSQAKAYNNDKEIGEDFGTVGIAVNIPLVDMTRYSDIQEAKLSYKLTQTTLELERLRLQSKAKALQNSLVLLQSSIALHQKSIQNKKELLKIAKINYQSGRLSTEEYLRYEDDLVAAKAALYKTIAKKWQTLMQLSVIYANNIEEMVR